MRYRTNVTNPILITHAISHRLYPVPTSSSGYDDAARATLAPLLGNDNAAVDCDCNIDNVAWPVSFTTINTTGGIAAKPRADAGDRVAFRLRLNSKKKAVTVLPEEALALVVLRCKRAVHWELRKLSMVNIGRIDCSVILEEDDKEDGGEGGSGSTTSTQTTPPPLPSPAGPPRTRPSRPSSARRPGLRAA
jgi:hypothetical protein